MPVGVDGDIGSLPLGTAAIDFLFPGFEQVTGIARAIQSDLAVERAGQRHELAVAGIDMKRGYGTGEARREAALVPAERGDRQEAVIETGVDNQGRQLVVTGILPVGFRERLERGAAQDDAMATFGGEPAAVVALGIRANSLILVVSPLPRRAT